MPVEGRQYWRRQTGWKGNHGHNERNTLDTLIGSQSYNEDHLQLKKRHHSSGVQNQPPLPASFRALLRPPPPQKKKISLPHPGAAGIS